MTSPGHTVQAQSAPQGAAAKQNSPQRDDRTGWPREVKPFLVPAYSPKKNKGTTEIQMLTREETRL